MTGPLKVAVIGGGSTYTPELVDGLGRLAGRLDVAEVALCDPDEARLAVVGPLAQRILTRLGSRITVTCHTSLEPAIDDAGAVLLQLRVGGQRTRHRDETWPLECGCIGQETVGAGGLAKALRTVPVALGIADRARELAADDAWIIDFTNPVGIVTRALLDAGHRTVGLCNVAIGFQRECAGLLGVDPHEVSIDHVGLNHLTWERAAYVDGVDRLPRLIEEHGAELAEGMCAPESIVRRTGAVPSYYLQFYYDHDELVREQRGAPTRAEKVAQVEADLLRLYADPALDHKPAELEQRGGAFYSEAAVGLLTSLVVGDGATHVANVRNRGALPFLPDEAVIEVPSTIGRDGAHALPVQPLPPLARSLVAHVSAYEELAVQAALHGGRDRVESALLAHPTVGQYDLAERLTDSLLAENAEFLSWA